MSQAIVTQELRDDLQKGSVNNFKGQMVEPQPFPKGDNMWREFFRIDIESLPYWLYTNEDNEILFIIIRKETKSKSNKTGKAKKFMPGSYGSGRYHKELLWKDLPGWKRPLYRLGELTQSDLNEVFVVEGEETCKVAQTLFPDIFVTTFMGGKGNYEKTDWSPLKKRNVTLFSDIDFDGKGYRGFEDLAAFLKSDYDIEAKLVPFSRNHETYNWIKGLSKSEFQKNAWDLADTIYPGIDIHELIESAVIPEPRAEEEIPYSNIEAHINDFVFLSDSGTKYWDRVKRKIIGKETIDTLFLRGHENFKGKATDWLNKNNSPTADGTTFFPKNEEFIYHNDNKLVNLFREPRFKPLELGAKYNLDWLWDLMRKLCSNEEDVFELMKDMLAFALQHPEKNRRWAFLMQGGQGVGKGAFFEVLQKILGSSNCVSLKLSQLYKDFNSFMLRSNNIFVREANSKGSEDNQSQATMKDLITEVDHTIELKGRDTFPHYCHYNLYMSSNESAPFKIEGDDRRIFHVKCELLPEEESYFINLFNHIEDHDHIREVFHYFKNVHVISKKFSPGIAPNTKWKIDLKEASQTGYAYELNRLYQNKTLPCFHFDMFNKEEGMKDLHNWSTSDNRSYGNPLSIHNGFTEKRLQNWIDSIPGSFKYRSYAIEPKGQRRGAYWVINNTKYWQMNKQNIQAVHDHFNDPLTEARIDKDMKANSCPFGDPWKSEKEKAAEQLAFDKKYPGCEQQYQKNKTEQIFNKGKTV
jgi:hypothetical protein